jgi:hypothetical protein
LVISLLGILVIAACGEDVTQPPVVPTSTPSPTASATSTPVPTATQPLSTVAIDVTKDHLAAMVFSHTEVQLEFPFLQPEASGTGFRDNSQAILETLDPDDTAENLAARGRIDGYGSQFVDVQVLASGLSLLERPLSLSASLELMDSPESARRNLQDRNEEIRDFQGVEVAGNVIREYRQDEVAGIGETAVFGRLTIALAAFGATTEVGFFSWQTGPIVANIAVSGFDDSDRQEALERLAGQMDRRIQRVLAGEIPPEPTSPAATAPAGPGGAETPAGPEGFDLAAMPPERKELPEGLAIVAEGFLESEGSIAYQRDFEVEAQAPNAESLAVTSLRTRVDLYGTAVESLAVVAVLTSLGPDVLLSLIEQSIGQGVALTADDVVTTPVTAPLIGDASGGFHVSVVAPEVQREMYLFFTARGRISSQLVLQGPPGGPTLDVAVATAQLIDDRIAANSP